MNQSLIDKLTSRASQGFLGPKEHNHSFQGNKGYFLKEQVKSAFKGKFDKIFREHAPHLLWETFTIIAYRHNVNIYMMCNALYYTKLLPDVKL